MQLDNMSVISMSPNTSQIEKTFDFRPQTSWKQDQTDDNFLSQNVWELNQTDDIFLSQNIWELNNTID